MVALRRMPAVSVTTKRWPPWTTSESMASRVVPATSETTKRSVPSSALTKVDLPTLGRPTMAMRMSPVGRCSSVTSSGSSAVSSKGSNSGGGGAGSIPRAATMASSSSWVPRPCSAETGKTSPNPSS